MTAMHRLASPWRPAALALFAAGCLQARADRLDDWIGEALDRNPDLAAGRAWAAMARTRIGMESSLMDPMAGVKWMRSENTDLLDPDMTEWSIEQSVPWPGKRGARARAAAAEADAADRAVEARAEALRARVVGAFWNLWSAQNRVQLVRESLEAVSRMEAAARARYATSAGGAQADVLRAEIEAARMRDALVTARREADAARVALNALCASPADTPRDALQAPPPLPAEPPDAARLLERAVARGPALRAAAARRDAAEARGQSARRESAPDLRFMVEARQSEGGAAIREYDTLIGLTLPWLWRGKYDAMRREAAQGLRMAEADASALEQETSARLAELCAAADAGLRGVRLYERDIGPRLRQLIEASLTAYRSGQGDFISVVDAVRQEVEARMQANEARASVGRTLAEIESMAGPDRGSAGTR